MTLERLNTVTRHCATGVEDAEVYVVGYARTPLGSFGGALSSMGAPALAATAMKVAMARAGVHVEQVDEVILGHVLSAGSGQAPAKQAALQAGLPTSVPCTSLNKVCSSGMKAISASCAQIMTGQGDIIVCGGMESMSQAPFLLPNKARFSGLKFGSSPLTDSMEYDGLTNPFNGEAMGVAAEQCAEEHHISREEQDAYALESYRRAQEATKQGLFQAEICPVTVKGPRGSTTVVDQDEDPFKVKKDKVPHLQSPFKAGGSVTAANASNINDGACVFVLASGKAVRTHALNALCRIVSFADASKEPERFTTAPSLAIPKALEKAKLATQDIDYFEINEAFSVVSLANRMLLGLDASKLNIWGGAVALGHPLGCSGARIVATLLSVLRHNKARYGCAGICNGGGGASAIVLERISSS